MTKTVSVNAIKQGTVIDHITPGQAVNIIRMLGLTSDQHQMTIGLNLKGKRTPFKDLIKIENRTLSDFEAQEIAVLSPGATINLIDDYAVSKKITVSLPDDISGILVCPNTNCVTHTEPVKTLFYLQQQKDTIRLTCRYCEKAFKRDDIKEYCA